MKGRFFVAGDDWMETSATVVASVFQNGSLSESTEEMPIDMGRFLITFAYEVDGRGYLGQMERYDAATPGSRIEILYNPAKPQENNWTYFPESAAKRIAAWLLGLALSAIIIYLAYRYDWPSE